METIRQTRKPSCFPDLTTTIPTMRSPPLRQTKVERSTWRKGCFYIPMSKPPTVLFGLPMEGFTATNPSDTSWSESIKSAFPTLGASLLMLGAKTSMQKLPAQMSTGCCLAPRYPAMEMETSKGPTSSKKTTWCAQPPAWSLFLAAIFQRMFRAI